MDNKKLILIVLFLIPLIADWFVPGSGIFIEIAIFIWELLEPTDTDSN